jgi:outer membrane receptor protein involved in Fe transport
MKHELYFDPFAAGANGVHDHTMRHGLELEAHVMPVKDLDIYGKYTLEKAFFVGSHYAGNQIPMVPEQKFTGGLTYTFMDCVDVNYTFNFVGDRRFISDQLDLMRVMKYYITNDIRVGYRKEGFEIYGKLNNIFNNHYSEIGSWGQYYPANGRNFVFGVKQKF